MRVVVLGCGTGVGKTRVSVALLRALAARGQQSMGLKPVESGLSLDESSLALSDARTLANAGSVQPRSWLPLFNFPEPISPHLAARAALVTIEIGQAVAWVTDLERKMTGHAASHSATWSVVETAGGVFSPLSSTATNFDLALALEPATWVLVAADSLGVLHAVSATLQAMRARGRTPDHFVLSGAHEADRSTGTNAAELSVLDICQVSAVLTRHDDAGVMTLVDALLAG